MDRSLTLFVGKNNSGKTSFMHLFQLILSDKRLAYDDYPLECRQILFDSMFNFWKGAVTKDDFVKCVQETKIRLVVDYSEEEEEQTLGALSAFIIDMDAKVEHAIIDITYSTSPQIEKFLQDSRAKYEKFYNTKVESNTLPDYAKLSELVRDVFSILFERSIAAVNPNNEKDCQERSSKQIQELFEIRSITAERSLDETEEKNCKPLTPLLTKIFSSELDEMGQGLQAKISQLTDYIDNTNTQLQSLINKMMVDIVTSMMKFGYPSAEELTLNTHTTISLINQIKNNTDLTYRGKDASEALPSTHNGLGYKNLIKITLLLYEYAQIVSSSNAMIPMLFIEEPEAHMHPQLQTTFVTFLTSFLSEIIKQKSIQVIITTHSAHVANTVPFSQVRYMRRYPSNVVCKNLMNFYKGEKADEEKKEHQVFLQKYLKLSLCDLYFCDKAILIEGASERLLLPRMIEKCQEKGVFGKKEPTLASQYYTIIEVGGAYAHKFYDFVDFLEIPTLILTDIDFIDQKRKKCMRNTAVSTSNGAILHWYRQKKSLSLETPINIDSVLELQTDDQLSSAGYRKIMFQYEENGLHPRSLEDAIINVNRTLFDNREEDNISFDTSILKKTDFALQLLTESKYDDFEVPSYINKGLVWLNDQPKIPPAKSLSVEE